MSNSVFLAVGHGKSTDGTWDTGTVYGSDTEADLMYNIAGYTMHTLQQNGVTVLSDYTTYNDRNMMYTVRDANAAGVDLYVSLHCDYEKAPSGTYPIIYPGSNTGYKLANCINASVMLRMGIGTRGVLQRDDYEVSSTQMPACIFETGSIKADNAILKDSQRYGEAIAYGILDYLGISYNATATAAEPAPAPTATNTLWSDINIQYFLNICNYGLPDIDGVYGADTARCVKIAQAAYGIAVDGRWGTVTQENASGQILQYQQRLNNVGVAVTADGIAGIDTFNAVKIFQGANGLEVDGIVGTQTFSALFGITPTPAPTPTDTPNFAADEFKCECGCGGDVKPELKQKVQALRDLLTKRAGRDMPLVITSGFRCAAQNARDGGVSDSLHLTGDACDLYTPGMSDDMVDEIAHCAQAVGLGTIRYYQSRFVHVQLYPRDTVGN